MKEQYGKVHCKETLPVELSVKNLQNKNFHKKPVRLQITKPSKNDVKFKQSNIPVHYTWALILTIFCFFLIGPCWALYKTRQLRQMIAEEEFEEATRLSNKITVILVLSTIIGSIVWVGILFCSAGLILTGVLLKKRYI